MCYRYYILKIISLGKQKNLSKFCHVLNWLYQSKPAGKHEELRVKMISLKNRATQNMPILSEIARTVTSEVYITSEKVQFLGNNFGVI